MHSNAENENFADIPEKVGKKMSSAEGQSDEEEEEDEEDEEEEGDESEEESLEDEDDEEEAEPGKKTSNILLRSLSLSVGESIEKLNCRIISDRILENVVYFCL